MIIIIITSNFICLVNSVRSDRHSWAYVRVGSCQNFFCFDMLAVVGLGMLLIHDGVTGEWQKRSFTGSRSNYRNLPLSLQGNIICTTWAHSFIPYPTKVKTLSFSLTLKNHRPRSGSNPDNKIEFTIINSDFYSFRSLTYKIETSLVKMWWWLKSWNLSRLKWRLYNLLRYLKGQL